MSRLKEQLESNPQDEQILQFDFWKDLQVVQEFSAETFKKIIGPSPRCTILDILVEGIEEPHPLNGELKIRRALSATEILDRLNGNKKKGIEAKTAIDPDIEPVKRTNLYFHLEKLEEHGVIKVISTTQTGKRSTTYYGRVAKALMPAHDVMHELYLDPKQVLLDSADFTTLLTRLSPDVSKSDIKKAIKLSKRMFNYNYTTQMEDWWAKNGDELQGLDFDIRKVFDLFSILYRYDHKTLSGLAKLSEMLKLGNLD